MSWYKWQAVMANGILSALIKVFPTIIAGLTVRQTGTSFAWATVNLRKRREGFKDRKTGMRLPRPGPGWFHGITALSRALVDQSSLPHLEEGAGLHYIFSI